MSQYVYNHIKHIFLAIILVLPFILGNASVGVAQAPEDGVQWDKPIQIPSSEGARAWFPDLAVDSKERVHVIWNETKTLEDQEEERVFYSMWDGSQWLPFNDILPPRPDIIRHALAVDSYDILHMTSGWSTLNYREVPADEAISAGAWTAPRLVNSRNGTYLSDIAAYGDTLHLVYDDAGEKTSDIFYRRSTDRGLNWLEPIPLLGTEAGSSRAQLEIDKNGVLYVAWDEGWDRFTGLGSPERGVYMYSTDEGDSWSEPVIVSYPNTTNTQMSVGSDGQGGVMLVWRTISLDYLGIYYMWSTDQGKSWSPPKTIPGILARSWDSPFDVYDMATDSAGNIHLLAGCYIQVEAATAQDASPSLCYLVWDGAKWSPPTPVYDGEWYPEYPHLVISRGNQLHATWFVRDYLKDNARPSQIWYAHGQLNVPAETPVPLPTPTPTPTPLLPTPVPTATPPPFIDPALVNIPAQPESTASIYTENDDVLLLVQSLLPAMLIVALVIVGIRFWRR